MQASDKRPGPGPLDDNTVKHSARARAALGHLARIQSRRAWMGTALSAGAILLLAPLLNRVAAPGSFLHLPDYMVIVLGKFLCYAAVALSIDLIWGFTGILSLGHGAFFALGGYAMGMHLMRAMAGQGVYRSDLPDFMVFLDWKQLPWFWQGFDSLPFALAMVVAVPSLLALLIGYLAFRSRISGVYFSILTQAMTYALMLLFFRNNTGFGGNNGLTDFKTLLGFSLQDPDTKLGLCMLSGAMLLCVYLLCRFVTASKLGRVLTAIRDAESRVRFSGYQSLRYKLFAWTLSAVICAVAGALYVPQAGIINPSEMTPANSIEMAVWVAVGGRGTLTGAIAGSLLVNGAKSWFTAAFPELWLYVLGLLFILTTLFLPQGVIGAGETLHCALARLRPPGRRPALVRVPKRTPEGIPEMIPKMIPAMISEKIPENLPGRIPQEVLENVSKPALERVPARPRQTDLFDTGSPDLKPAVGK